MIEREKRSFSLEITQPTSAKQQKFVTLTRWPNVSVRSTKNNDLWSPKMRKTDCETPKLKKILLENCENKKIETEKALENHSTSEMVIKNCYIDPL